MKNERFTVKLWQQLWACAAQLQRELQQSLNELCWQRKPLVVPDLRRYQDSPKKNGSPNDPSSEAVAQDCKPTESHPKEADPQNEGQKVATPSAPSYLSKTHDSLLPNANPPSWQEAIAACGACNLGQQNTRIRQQAIVGQATGARPRLLLVCDAPDYEANRHNLPLPPDNLEYLQKWMAAIHMESNYYLTNLVKCRPSGNRAPWPEEVKREHLERQLAAMQPHAVLALGGSTARSLSRQCSDLETLRNRKLYYPFQNRNIPLFVTYAVAEVLRNQELRRPVWQDLKRLRVYLQQL